MVAEDKSYYVYILFKTYKKGFFTYSDLNFNMEPFYVGKGRDKRIIDTVNVRKNKNSYKNNILEKIHLLNLTVTSVKIGEHMLEKDAFDLEKELISKIGRYDRGLGPLANMTDGGEGGSGGTSRTGDWPELYAPVLMYDLNGDLLKEYDSIKKAKSENPKAKNISYCCQLKRDTSGGFIWRYKGSDETVKKIDVSFLIGRTQSGNNPVAVIQKNEIGEIIGEFDSIKEASIQTGCSSSKIVLVCQKKRSKTNGYFFEYKK
jgi:hypothetical protein